MTKTQTKTETKNTNVTVACDDDLIVEIDAAIRTLNKKLPRMAQINRARFVRGCVGLGLENLDQLLK